MCTHMPCVPGVVEYKTAYIMQFGLSISHQILLCTLYLLSGSGQLSYGCVHEKYDRSFYLPAPTFIYGCVHCIATREVLILLGASRVKKGVAVD
jgi:hypothetical protein